MTAESLTVLERAVYRGPHLFSALPMIRIQIDLGPLEDYPTSRLPGFEAALLGFLPGLANHGCSARHQGGFVARLRDGTWLGHVIEHVAIELQNLAGHKVTRGKTRSVKGQPGCYNVMYHYLDEDVGVAAGALAVRLVAGLVPAEFAHVEGLNRLTDQPDFAADDIEAAIAHLRQLARASALGPSTAALAAEARRRGIPVMRLNQQSLIQFGHGNRQQRIRASVTGRTGLIAAELAGNKAEAKQMLAESGLPVPRGIVVRQNEDAIGLARRLKRPLVVKPLDANHGRGVTTGISDDAALMAAIEAATKLSRRIIIEEQMPGNDHRILVVNGKMVAAAERIPAQVFGDGEHSIGELIALVNEDPRRGRGHENVLTQIVPDAAMQTLLGERDMNLDYVPRVGQKIQLRGTANLSSGGTAVDCTDIIHPDNVRIAEHAAAAIGLDVAGIDLLSPDITRPIRETGGGIVEVNAAPGLRMHLEPSEGTPRDVAKPILASLFPPGRQSRTPIFAVTGTNGKSTTVRMLARILCEAEHTVGMTTTSGIYINGHLLMAADASGPKSARTIFRNPLVDVAVLETARGGILREGLAFDHCDVGAVLNVTADHLGLKGIETVEDLAQVKSVVTESVARRGHSILNADDPMTVRIARYAGGKIVWFSTHSGAEMSPMLREHVAAGGIAVARDGDHIMIYHGGAVTNLMHVEDIPATMNGIVQFNIDNAMAAAAMAFAHGISVDAIRKGLADFDTSFDQSPGRFNVHDAHGFRVIVDYAHNPAALINLGRVVGAMRGPNTRAFGMVSIPGDRRDEDLVEMGRLAAGIFDEIMFREAPDGRGRPAGSINALMSEGAKQAGMAEEHVHRLKNEEMATQACLEAARPGDLVVLMPTQVEKIWQQVLDFVPQSVVQPETAEREHA
jgi:cyanophycin synthetase